MSFNTVPFNPFPPSSDQQGSGGGGSYVLPIAADDTLGGIKVGDNLTIEEDGTLNAEDPYELPIAADDTLGGVKVGTGLSINSETGVLSADSQTVDYSTTEQDTGKKWLDDSPIYSKTVELTVPSDVNTGIHSFNVNTPGISAVKGVEIISSTNITGYVPWYSVASVMFSEATETKIDIYFGGNHYAGQKIYVTLYYTKTESEV